MMLLTVAGLSACTAKAKQVSNETESNQTKTDMSNMSDNQSNVSRAYEFVKQAGVYFIATEEGSQARVRPFSSWELYEGKIYILTGKKKDVYKQIEANPKVEICAQKDGRWIRIACELVLEDRIEPKTFFLDNNPSSRKMGYDEHDENTAIMYLKKAQVKMCRFGSEPEVFEF